jgi:hypothetical protein
MQLHSTQQANSMQHRRRALDPLTKPRTATLHATRFHHSIFANQGLAKQGNQESRAETARKSLHAGKVPNGVRWKNLSRRYRVRRLLEIRFLELAKGFEPPTL